MWKENIPPPPIKKGGGDKKRNIETKPPAERLKLYNFVVVVVVRKLPIAL